MQAAEVLDRCGDKGVCRGTLGDVAWDEQRLAAQSFDLVDDIARLQIVDDDIRAGRSQCERLGSPQTRLLRQ